LLISSIESEDAPDRRCYFITLLAEKLITEVVFRNAAERVILYRSIFVNIRRILDLEAEIGYSRSHFLWMFRATTGVTLHRYVLRRSFEPTLTVDKNGQRHFS
jgi:AraC-like DNA-binding protein